MASKQTARSARLLSAYHNLHGPAWRWKVINELLLGNTLRVFRRDPYVKQALHYLNVEAAKPARNRPRSVIADALRLRDHTELRQQIELAVLGGLTPAEIEQLYRLPPAILEAFEKLFFDVRTSLSATGWIRTFVLAPLKKSNPELSTKFALACYGGPEVTREILDSVPGKVSEGLAAIQQQRRQLELLTAQAITRLEGRLEEYAPEVIKLYMWFRSAEQRLELQMRWLEEYSLSRRRRYELRLLREERTRQREAERARIRQVQLAERERLANYRREVDLRTAELMTEYRDQEQRLAARRGAQSALAGLVWQKSAAPPQVRVVNVESAA